MHIGGGSHNCGVETLVGDSSAMRSTRELIKRLGPTSLSVLIQGPTGVGKELVAEALHRESRRAGPFVAVNVCAIPEAVFESLLFGHVRGAFTGALHDHVGHLTDAHRGTLFLDEIGELPLPLQVKLLRALETRRFRKVGARVEESSDFRLVVATNADLALRVRNGEFRADLAFRFGAAVISIPPLADRASDIAPLASYFARKVGGAEAAITREALDVLSAYSWPGNARELWNTIEFAATLANGAAIQAHHLGSLGAFAPSPDGEPATSVEQSDEDDERELLIRVLDQFGWNIPAAARALEVTRKTVYVRIRRLGLTIPGRYRRRRPPREAELRAIRIGR